MDNSKFNLIQSFVNIYIDARELLFLPDDPVISIALRFRAFTTVTVSLPAVGR